MGGRGGGVSGDIIFHNLGRKVSIVYRYVEYQSSCAVVWFGDLEPPPPPTQVSVGELYIQGNEGIEKTAGGKPFSMGKAVRGPKSYDSTETVVLYVL